MINQLDFYFVVLKWATSICIFYSAPQVRHRAELKELNFQMKMNHLMIPTTPMIPSYLKIFKKLSDGVNFSISY